MKGNLFNVAAVTIAAVISVSCASSNSQSLLQVSWESELGTAWKGEKLGAKLQLVSSADLKALSIEAGSLRCGSSVIPAEAVSVNFLSPVVGDVLDTTRFSQCGEREAGKFASIIVDDIIDTLSCVELPENGHRGVWLGVKVPQTAKAGLYKGAIAFRIDGKKALSLPVSLEVVDRTLPEPKDWAFHLDLWQNPYSVARYHDVPLWSEEHFEHMKPVMELLASAGQKAITASIIDRPWNGQTEDAFGSMIAKTRFAEGSWTYDYSIFDKWVEWMMSLGIDWQISCYTMIPWRLSFDYIDAQTGEQKELIAAPGSEAYRDYWGSLLADFSEHLKSKGWLEKTYVSMDERDEDEMAAALAVIHEFAPEMKVSLAGSYHESIASDLDYLCIGIRSEYPDGVVEQRRSEGKTTTYYVCCAERFPNTFIASDPDEAEWIGWYAYAHGLDGFLRWAYNSWTVDPVSDARFRTWPAGDCYIVYPDGRSSVRMERLIQGVQGYEKASIMAAEAKESPEAYAALEALDEALEHFTFEELAQSGPAAALALVHEAVR